MAIIRDRSLLNEDGSIPNKLLMGCINEHKQEINERLQKLHNYYEGKHLILNRTFDNVNIPNNKLVANHAEYITDLAVGYVFGVPVSYTGAGAEAINKNFTEIDEDSHNNDLAINSSVFGRAYELVYMSDDEKPIIQLAELSPLNTFLVVDNTVMKRPIFAYITMKILI